MKFVYQFLFYVVLAYSQAIYYSSFIFYKCCRALMKYYPEHFVPSIFHRKSIKIKEDAKNIFDIDIKNIQYVSSKINIPKDITKKGKILIKLLWNSKIGDRSFCTVPSGGFILDNFVKYLGDCVMLYIDYRITLQLNAKNNIYTKKTINVKKIVNMYNLNNPTYMDGPTSESNIPQGEIVFD